MYVLTNIVVLRATTQIWTNCQIMIRKEVLTLNPVLTFDVCSYTRSYPPPPITMMLYWDHNPSHSKTQLHKLENFVHLSHLIGSCVILICYCFIQYRSIWWYPLLMSKYFQESCICKHNPFMIQHGAPWPVLRCYVSSLGPSDAHMHQ